MFTDIMLNQLNSNRYHDKAGTSFVFFFFFFFLGGGGGGEEGGTFL